MANSENETLAMLEQVRQQMAEMQATIQQQQVEIAFLRQASEMSALPEASAATTPDQASGLGAVATGRRTLIKWMGVAAAGTAATAAGVVMTAPTAHAANGDAITVGNTVQGTSTTTVQGATGSSAGPLFWVDNSSATSASGLWGYGSQNYSGVYGQADGASGRGVYGVSDQGYGLAGATQTGIDIFALGTGRFQQVLQTSVGAPAIFGNAGEQIRDANGDLWLCTQSGNRSAAPVWVRAAYAQSGYTGGALNFFAAPIRVIDTRSGQTPPAPLPTTKAPLKSGSTTTFQITGTAVGGVSVPSGAVGVYANVTVVFPTNGGNLIFYPTGTSVPTASTLNYNPGTQVVGNFTIVGLSTSGQFDVVVNGPGNTDVVVDIAGFIM